MNNIALFVAVCFFVSTVIASAGALAVAGEIRNPSVVTKAAAGNVLASVLVYVVMWGVL